MSRVGRPNYCISICLSLLIIFIGFFKFVPLVVGAQRAEIKIIDPDTGEKVFRFYTNTTIKGSRFNVTIFVYDVTDLFAFQVYLEVNDNFLNITNAWLPDWDTQYVFYGKDKFKLGPEFYDTDHDTLNNAVLVGDTLLLTTDTFTGSGLLAIIELEIVNKPSKDQVISCDLSIDNSDTILLNSRLDEIPLIKTNGVYEYVWAGEPLPYLAIEPQNYVAKELLEDINYVVYIKNVKPELKLTNITLKIVYNSTLLKLKDVSEGSFLKGLGETVFNWTPSNGHLTIINYLKEGYATVSEGAVATITFSGIYQDGSDHKTSIKFESIELVNVEGNPIESAEPKSAFYTILAAESEIIINLDRNFAYIGSGVTISGYIIPPKVDVDVTIEFRYEMGNWKTLVVVKTSENGSYSYTWYPSREQGIVEDAYYYFKASWPGDALNKGAESEEVRLKIGKKEPSTVSIEILQGNVVLVSENITIRGELSPVREGVNITIYYRVKGETEWNILHVVKTNSEGKFHYTWLKPEIGDYELRAYWAGDEATEEAYSDVIVVSIVETMPTGITAYTPYIVAGVVAIIIIAVIFYFKKH